MSLRPEPVLDQRFLLGEGPVWDDRTQRLIFVDILASRVHVLDPETRVLEAFETGEEVGAAAPTERDSHLVLAVRHARRRDRKCLSARAHP
jgi:sugar lactone lactonase YvrE